jgi:2-polyprenyl-3-methyl-5-hydroxy-6-metoxy-1,4-benzoquinol methylase
MDHIHESQPAEFLVENVTLLPKGRVLDIAMGRGRNAIYLAKLGFQVEGVDISKESADEALLQARQEGVHIDQGDYSLFSHLDT